MATPCSLGSACGRHLASSKTPTSISTRYGLFIPHVPCRLCLFPLFQNDEHWLARQDHACNAYLAIKPAEVSRRVRSSCGRCEQVVRHADYPMSHFAALAAALSPAAAYCAQHQALHLCQLPSHVPRAGVGAAQCASRTQSHNFTSNFV